MKVTIEQCKAAIACQNALEEKAHELVKYFLSYDRSTPMFSDLELYDHTVVFRFYYTRDEYECLSRTISVDDFLNRTSQEIASELIKDELAEQTMMQLLPQFSTKRHYSKIYISYRRCNLNG